MGEQADMMLDGTLCAQCGAWIDDDIQGVPRLCGGCAEEEAATIDAMRCERESDGPLRSAGKTDAQRERARQKRRRYRARRGARRAAAAEAKADA